MASEQRQPAAAAMDTGPPSLLYSVKQVELAVRSHLDELLRPSGITALQYTALTVLHRRSGLTIAELARNSFVTPQAMADLLKVLQRRELISRTRDPDNRRQVRLRLTEAGAALLDHYGPAVRRLEELMLTEMDAGDRESLADLLNRCRASLTRGPRL
ncbi:HTH-type transcriptional repressor NicR [Pseudonocardia autotrophica]|nr:HTH-type transcriptional repressor NicR [Pseudonocardia autotrophica]